MTFRTSRGRLGILIFSSVLLFMLVVSLATTSQTSSAAGIPSAKE